MNLFDILKRRLRCHCVLLLTVCAYLLAALTLAGCNPKSMPDKSKFIGQWNYDRQKATVALHEDGRAEMIWTDTTYTGKWFLPDERHLVLRIVVPLNRPDIDDELNAEEMYYSLTEVTADKIVAKQFDDEGVHTFTRIQNKH